MSRYHHVLRRCWPFIVLATIALQPLVALASGDAGHAAEENHGIPTALKLGIMTVNLMIFLWVLRRSAWPMMVEWVAARRSDVVGALEKAARAQREAEALEQQWKDRLASLDEEIAAMRAQAQKQIESERDQILESARKLAESIRRDAERAAQQELRNAQEQLRAEVAERAFQIACETAPAQLGATEQKRFVDEFVAQVAK